MAFNVGELIATIKLETDAFQRGIKEVTNQTGRLNKGFNNVTDSLGEVGRKFISLQGAILGVGLGAVIADIGMAGAQYARLEETLEVVRKRTGMTTEEIKNMKDALEDANLQGSDATKTLLTFVQSGLGGITDMQKFTLMAKDYSASIGVSSKEGVRDFTEAVGALNPELLRKYRLITNLVEVYGDYAESIGKNRNELTSQEKRIALLNKIYEEHDKTVKGVYKETYDTASKALSSIKDATSSLKDELGLVLEPAIQKIAVTIRNFIQDAIKWFEANQDKVKEWGETLANVAVRAIDALIGFVKFLVNNKEIIIGFFMAVGLAIGVAFGQYLLGAGIVMKTFLATWALITTALKYAPELIEWVRNSFNQLKITIGEVASWFVDRFGFIYNFFKWWWDNLTYPLLSIIYAIFARIFWGTLEVTKEIFGLIQEAVKIALENVVAFVGWWGDMVKAVFEIVTGYIRQKWGDEIDFIMRVWDALITFFRNKKDEMVNGILAPFREVKRGLEEWAKNVKDLVEKINPYHRESPSLVDNVKAGLSEIQDAYNRFDSGFNVSGVAGIGNVGGIVINMNGSIGSVGEAQRMGEAMGDQIINKLRKNVRF